MCEICRRYPCAPACPNYEPNIMYKCERCGRDICAGDTAYVVGNKYYYCDDCCCATEVEPNDDSLYDR